MLKIVFHFGDSTFWSIHLVSFICKIVPTILGIPFCQTRNGQNVTLSRHFSTFFQTVLQFRYEKLHEISAKNQVSGKKDLMGLLTSATSLAEARVVYSSVPGLGRMHTAGAGADHKFLGVAVVCDVSSARSSVSSVAIDFV